MKFIALLRGINVGGKASVPMKELASICSKLGWENIETYLRTGNVVFDAVGKTGQLEEILENAIAREFSLSIPVIVRSQNSFCSRLKDVPFPSESQNDPGHLLLYLSKSPPMANAVEGLMSKATAGESVIQQGDSVWIYYPNGIAGSRITPAVIDRSIGSPATGRNWNTLMKVQRMCQS